ncbi:hypothetical protein ACIP5T_00685 [Microbacterium sp. NPDC088619]|uniref:hypothetical protein n=1 Tax=Microbacterium sp. NPDC088619 TaxID=3364196 RepID=UPI00382524E0
MSTRRTLLAIGAAAVAALALFGFGFDWPFVIGWSLLICAVGLLGQLVMPLEPGFDAPRIATEPDRRPTEISRMAWALNTHTGIAGQQITRRVTGILRHRLLRQGIDPDDSEDRARLSAAIGAELWDRLTGPAPTIIDIERALDAVDRLSPTNPGELSLAPHAPATGPGQPSLFRRSRR